MRASNTLPHAILRVAVALFVVVTAGLAISWWRYYLSLLDSCEAENRYLGRSGLDCLEPGNWFAIDVMLFASAIGEIAVAVVVGAAFVHRRKRQLTET
jgi:hypothetical protein